MRMGYGLELTQSQKLVMTPQLKQAITVLQLNALELDQYVKDQMVSNPVLEVTEEKEKTLKNEKEQDINWKEYIEDFDNRYYSPNNYNPEQEEFSYENIVSKEATLQEHLLFQLHLTSIEGKYHEIGEFIINNLDENGYLSTGVDIIAKDINEEPHIIEGILKIIQTFDPAGVGARNIKESLLIQLKSKNVEDERVYEVVENYLEMLGSNKYPVIAKKLQTSLNEVKKICEFIRSLEPKPGRQFITNQNKYIVPDVIVRKIQGEYVVVYNDSAVPRLYIREDYRKMVLDDEKLGCKDTKKYLNDKLNAAVWLIKNIEQRKQTIYRVVENIIEKQKDFFEHGKKYLKPLTLKEVAEELEVHESTVSRATNGKYVQTPAGTFELKFFFSSGINISGGEALSSNSIKDYIRELISREDPKKPLSDEKIAKYLREKGMTISRRTVAKYRDDLKILSSSKRKYY
ncbi:RNA polymerase factor sigma-54 [Isachenkonia alkalipeptolytica]|uniref:RNA polymerase factor sigma-54 n=1 Tax=Isachenkonia alkalipeptolytica TaxID=2565777 RepID=A0AA43XMJ0_9CLOT|nr:RNA polymerase factor sigma-54 [Isachenkonia alkalipeptolytica]NBG89191.1 RNA polymerase factor sigma-54 [Isachenkonia alkalipeptolytica]